MRNSNRIGWTTGKAGRNNNVQMIDVTHKVSAIRRAKVVFWVLLFTVGTTTAVIASAIVHPVLAVVIGLLVGLAVGGLIGAIVFIWPALRVIWHWLTELTLFGLTMAAYVALVHVMTWWLALLVLAFGMAGPFGFPGVRRVLMSWIWCGISRHRLRTAFAAFIASNRYGTQPLILLARPTPAGERVWIWLRPGLSLSDLESRRDKLAVVCWGKDVRVSPASGTRAALVQVDITRRNPLTKTIDSPLPDLIAELEIPADAPVSPAVVIPTALDLPDVPETGDTPPADKPEAARRPVRAVSDPEQVDDNDPSFWAD